MIKKLSIYTLLLLFTTNLFAQTWEKLGCDTTGFLNMDKNSTAVLKNYNQTNYVSEFRDVYKFGNYGWKKIQSLNALTIDYDFLVIENDTVIYAYVLNSTITVVKTKDTYLSTIGTANFSSIKANTIKISRSVNGSLVISFLSNSGNLLKVMSYINNVW